MIKLSILMFAATLAASPATAQTAEGGAPAVASETITPSDTVVSAEGSRLGRVDSVRGNAVQIIYKGKFVQVPVASLTRDGKRLRSSLKLAEILRR